jgi:inner membrane protein
MNRFHFLFKAVAVGFITLLLLIPLGMIHGTVTERAAYRQEAIASVARSFAGPQSVAGPVLVLPYWDARDVVTKDAAGRETTTVERTRGNLLWFPETFAVEGTVVDDTRKLGLYPVRVYQLDSSLRASFDAAVPADPGDPAVRRTLGRPYLSLSLADVRGLAGTPVLTVDGRAVALEQGAGEHREDGGLHATLAPVEPGAQLKLQVAIDLDLKGTDSLTVVPIGGDNAIHLQSKWRHPRFDGSFLPHKPAIGDAGFDAKWNITALAAGSQRQYREGQPLAALEHLEVRLVDPVDLYTQVDRATKYGLLFVLLTFTGFLLFELVRRLAIHPIQYGLVGLALAIFFLLLLSLSEHIDFLWAYLLASGACIGLLGTYLSAVLRSAARGWGFAGMLTLLYGALYGLLQSEDTALVLGSLLLFAILAAVMLLTRRIDWYALGRGDAAPATATTATAA